MVSQKTQGDLEQLRNGYFGFDALKQPYSESEKIWYHVGRSIDHADILRNNISRVEASGAIQIGLMVIVFLLTSFGIVWNDAIYTVAFFLILSVPIFFTYRKVVSASRQLADYLNKEFLDSSIAREFRNNGELIEFASQTFPDDIGEFIDSPENFDAQNYMGSYPSGAIKWIVLSSVSFALGATLFYGIIQGSNMWFNWIDRIVFGW